jgi:predicted dehydrogenase
VLETTGFSLTPFSKTNEMNPLPPLKIAVVGVGAFGELHAHTLAGLSETQLVALVDQNQTRARDLASHLKVAHVFASLEELLQSDCAQAVVVATRTEQHVLMAREILKHGWHVLIEKPVGISANEIADLEIASCNARGVAMAGHSCLFHSLTAPLIERVKSEGWRAAHFTRHRPAQTAQLFPEEHPFRMTMIHDLYVLAQMANNAEPSVIDGLDAGSIPDMSWATLRWEDGRVATLQAHWTLPAGAPSEGFDATEVFGDGYHTRIETNPQNSVWTTDKMGWPHASETSQVGGRPTGILAEELRSFIAACRENKVPTGCRLTDALQIQDWIEQLTQSAQQKRED